MSQIHPFSTSRQIKLNLPKELDWRKGPWQNKEEFFEEVIPELRYPGQTFKVVDGSNFQEFALIEGVGIANAVEINRITVPSIVNENNKIVVKYPDGRPDDTLLDFSDYASDREISDIINENIATKDLPTKDWLENQLTAKVDERIASKVNERVDSELTSRGLTPAQVESTIESKVVALRPEAEYKNPDLTEVTGQLEQEQEALQIAVQAIQTEVNNANSQLGNINASIDSRLQDQLGATIDSLVAKTNNHETQLNEVNNIDAIVSNAVTRQKVAIKNILDTV